MTRCIVTVFSSSDPLQTHKICLIVNIILPSAFSLFEGIAKKGQAELKKLQQFEHILRKCKFFEMSFYHEWPIEDEYEIHRIRTLVIRDIHSRLPLKDLVWVEEASIIFLFWKKESNSWLKTFVLRWGTQRIDCMGNITISPTSPIPHISSSIISMGISWMLQIREQDTMHNLFFNFG